MAKFLCNYCNHEFEVSTFTYISSYEVRCPQCKDAGLTEIKKDDANKDVFGYNHKERKINNG